MSPTILGNLGRSARSPSDQRDIRLASILDRGSEGTPRYDAPPFARDWSFAKKYDWLVNDRLGCCTITGIAHLMQNFAMRHGETLSFSDADIVEAYSAATGYVPGQPKTDRGGMMINALTRARTVGIGGKKIGAYVRVDYHNPIEVQAAINHLGGLYVGARLPRRVSEQSILKIPSPMNDRDAPGSLGGHAFAVLGYDRLYYKTLLWRDPQLAEMPWFGLYVDEAWAIIDDRWVSGERPAPNGFDMNRLKANLEAIGQAR